MKIRRLLAAYMWRAFLTAACAAAPGPMPTALTLTPVQTSVGLSPSPTPEVLGNGWYRFADREAGYSINYPSSAHLDAQFSAGKKFRRVTIAFPTSVGDELQDMEISVYSNDERTSLPDVVKQTLYGGRPPKNFKATDLVPLKIAGLDAVELQMIPFLPAVIIPAKGRIYFVALPMNMERGNPPTQASVDLFYKIAETFRLK